jgi:hypothetical protein
VEAGAFCLQAESRGEDPFGVEEPRGDVRGADDPGEQIGDPQKEDEYAGKKRLNPSPVWCS